MTVRQLIEALQKMPQDADVSGCESEVIDDEGEEDNVYSEVVGVIQSGNTVWFEIRTL